MCIIVYLSLSTHTLGRTVIDVEHLDFPRKMIYRWHVTILYKCIYLNIYIFTCLYIYIYMHTYDTCLSLSTGIHYGL